MAFPAISLMLLGCSVHPLPDDVPGTRKNTFDIVQAIRCEAKRGVLEHAIDARFEGAVIGYNFEFDIQEDSEVGASVTLKKKFGDGSVFTLPWTEGKTIKSRHAVRQFTIVDKFEELRKAQCDGIDTESKNILYPAKGSIGLFEVVSTFARIEKQTNFIVQAKFTGLDSNVAAFSDALIFTTEMKSGTFKPEFKMESLPTGRLSVETANISGSAGRKDIHKVTVALALAKGAEQRSERAGKLPVTSRTRLALQRFAGKAPVVTFTRTSAITEIDVHSTDDATARVLLELARRRQTQESDQRLQLLLELAK